MNQEQIKKAQSLPLKDRAVWWADQMERAAQLEAEGLTNERTAAAIVSGVLRDLVSEMELQDVRYNILETTTAKFERKIDGMKRARGVKA